LGDKVARVFSQSLSIVIQIKSSANNFLHSSNTQAKAVLKYKRQTLFYLHSEAFRMPSGPMNDLEANKKLENEMQ